MRKPSVLVVDDEPSIRTLLATALSLYGFSVTTAARAEEAIAALHSDDLSAAVVDVRMPGPSGLELLAYLRRDPARRDLPVVIFTGAELTDDEQAFVARHGAHLLYKPESHVALIEVLQQLTNPPGVG